MKFTIKKDELQRINEAEAADFPKYTSQLINLANQNAQGTRPKVVGKLSDLFPEFAEATTEILVEAWGEWYLEKHPTAIENATEKVYAHIQNLRDAIPQIDRDMVHKWVKDLVITKTFNGMYFQKAILAKIAELTGQEYRLATSKEESKGIDGFVGSQPYSIKPETYNTKNSLSEQINATMVYYKKTKTGLKIEVIE